MNIHQVIPGTIFLTGLSASGKSTLGIRLRNSLKRLGIEKVALLDGEDIRERLNQSGKTYGFSNEDRQAIAMEIATMALEMNKDGYVCIICAINHIKANRETVREKIGRYMEVFLDCSVAVCAGRDTKGHYQKAFSGFYDNFVGVTEPYEKSDRVELVLRTDTHDTDYCSQVLLEKVSNFIMNGRPTASGRDNRPCGSDPY